jgi:hypothetical protein
LFDKGRVNVQGAMGAHLILNLEGTANPIFIDHTPPSMDVCMYVINYNRIAHCCITEDLEKDPVKGLEKDVEQDP